jgi:hypothetical protein
MHLPGTRTIPDQIIDARMAYYNALEAADTICHRNQETGESNNPVAELEELLARMFAKQLVSSYSSATGTSSTAETDVNTI